MTKIAREMLKEARENYNPVTGEGADYLIEAWLFYQEETQKVDKQLKRVKQIFDKN